MHLQIMSQAEGPTLTELNKHFRTFELQKTPTTNTKSSDVQNTLDLRISAKEVVTLQLQKSVVLSNNHSVSLASGDKLLRRDLIATTYEGTVSGHSGSNLRLTIKDSYVYGYVTLGDKKYFVEPAHRFDKSLSEDFLLVYRASDVIEPKKLTCASSEEKSQKQRFDRQLKSSGSCQIVDVAIALDYSYVEDHGGTIGAINQSISVLNMVAGSYEGAFSDDIRFEISEHFVSDCSACDPWTSSTNANILLDAFTAWGPTGFLSHHDIGHLWTNRNLCGNTGDCSVAGLAWINAICSSQRYLILEDFTTTAWQLRVLVAHEMGHSFGANHDLPTSQDIMAPSIATDTESWSSTSVNVINTNLPNYQCLEECVIGACTEILSAVTFDCGQGNPSTYSLSLDIRHGGGGSSSTFDVIIDGQRFTQSWEESPQTVIITGLVADGTIDNTISIEADDNSDEGCGALSLYDVPASDCAIRVIENFDDCQLPADWSSASTNVFTWNGGDPLVQYEWKFDDDTRQFSNYDDQANSSSLLTIDGSCMALMDDDIINHQLYTGDVTMTSNAYDVSSVDTLRLKFDYNFHPFEDGGKGDNESFFAVEVFDGAEWIRVLHDDDSDCPWFDVWPSSCTESVDLDISSYINSNFAVRFFYSDGNDEKWTGMVALDNVEILGTVESVGSGLTGNSCTDGLRNGDETGIDCGGSSCPPCDACEDEVVVASPTDDNLFEARNLILTSGAVSLDQETVFSAGSTNISVSFEVLSGVTLCVYNDGCE